MRAAGAAALALLALGSGAAEAACTAPAKRLDYAVRWAGDVIGAQSLQFAQDGDALVVRVTSEVRARLLFMTLIDLKHESEERWVQGRLRSFKGRTVDNGDVTEVRIEAEGDALKVVRNGEATRVAADAVVGSLWCAETLAKPGAATFIDTVKGRTGAVTLSPAREETIAAGGSDIRARRVEITGVQEREVWHDERGIGVRARFPAKLGPKVSVELKAIEAGG
ncbi:MAG: hypothetical protein FJX51_02885 [Alphaproteobacteria bacterium]|nr:hypothetical protein [Alphaproteobacteria bacterium]